MKKFIILTFALACAFSVYAQDMTDEAEAPKKPERVKLHKQYPTVDVSGTVTDAVTGEPLAGVKLQAYNNTYYTAIS